MSDSNLVYVVDDDPAVLDSVEALLSQHAYTVQCFSNGRKFLDEADISSPACLISDVQMPIVNGVELLQRLNMMGSPISMIVVTGVADVPTAVSLMESGAVTLLEKPYDQSVLLNAVNRALSASHAQWQKRQADKSVHERLQSLSEEEHSVLKLMLAGEPNKNISSRLQLSMRTVDRRRQMILKKMQVESLPELALLMGRAG
jgi:two-component system, LuxR family, response regulator FixJ